MSENPTTTTQQADSNGTNPFANMTAEQAAHLMELAQKQQRLLDKAAEAKAKRQRENGRPLDSDGNEMKAPQAYLTVAADLLDEIARVYVNDPATTAAKLSLVSANMRVIGNGQSSSLSVLSDAQRKQLNGYFPPEGTDPVPAPKK